MSDDFNLGDLPDDIGSDHNQLIDAPANVVSTTPAGKRKKRTVSVPIWVRWLAEALIPNLSPALNFIARPFSTEADSFELAIAKKNRRYFLIQNNSAANIYINFDQDASKNQGIKIVPGGAYEPLRVPKNSVYVIGDTAGLLGFLVEG